MPCAFVRFVPPIQFMVMIASVSLRVLHATKKLLVVTVLLSGSIVTSAEPEVISRLGLTTAPEAA